MNNDTVTTVYRVLILVALLYGVWAIGSIRSELMAVMGASSNTVTRGSSNSWLRVDVVDSVSVRNDWAERLHVDVGTVDVGSVGSVEYVSRPVPVREPTPHERALDAESERQVDRLLKQMEGE